MILVSAHHERKATIIVSSMAYRAAVGVTYAVARRPCDRSAATCAWAPGIVMLGKPYRAVRRIEDQLTVEND